jgi:membrane protein implicated in regulation of membrane protease activity
VLVLGLVLLLIGWLTGIGILTTLGIILLVIGAVLWILGSTGRRWAAVGTGGNDRFAIAARTRRAQGHSTRGSRPSSQKRGSP